MRRRTPLCVEMIESRCLLSALAYSLTTNPSTYQVGQPVQMTFTETNTGSQPVQIAIGPVDSGFDVDQNGVTVWESNAGLQPQYLQIETLQPGQSVTLMATWNGVPNMVPPTVLSGTFTVTNQQAPTGASASFVIEPQTTTPTYEPLFAGGGSLTMPLAAANMGALPVMAIATMGTPVANQSGQAV